VQAFSGRIAALVAALGKRDASEEGQASPIVAWLAMQVSDLGAL
jgi:hypothetical protein